MELISLFTRNTSPPSIHDSIVKLYEIKERINSHWFSELSNEEKEEFFAFLWIRMNRLRKGGNSQLRIASMNVVGSALIRLSPFFKKELMSNLLQIISSTNEESILLLHSFCFLAKLFTVNEVDEILERTPILHLFGPEDPEQLPAIVQQLLPYSNDTLIAIAELMVKMAENDPTNRHYPRAASTIISRNQWISNSFIDSSIPVPLIASILSENIPQFPMARLGEIAESCISILKSESSTPSLYESACQVLKALFQSGQIAKEFIEEQITAKLIANAKALGPILELPVNPEFVRQLYRFIIPSSSIKLKNSNSSAEEEANSPPSVPSIGSSSSNSTPLKCQSSTFFKLQSSPSKTDEANCCNGFISITDCFFSAASSVSPLLQFFSKNVQFSQELFHLLQVFLAPGHEYYSAALKALESASKWIQKDELNLLIEIAINVPKDAWINRLWLLQFIQQTDFNLISRHLHKKIFKIISVAVTSNSEKLQIAAQLTVTKIASSLGSECFKYFIDYFIRHIDIFQPSKLEESMKFLSYVFNNVHGAWKLSFLSLVPLCIEIITTLPWSSELVADIFMTLSGIASGIHDSSTVLMLCRWSISMIEQSYIEFTGMPIGLVRPPIFESNIEFKNIISEADFDLLSSGKDSALKSAISAATFLSHCDWRELDLSKDDLSYLITFSKTVLCLFPEQMNELVYSCIDIPNIPWNRVKQFVHKSIASSTNRNTVFLLAKLIVRCTNRHGISIDEPMKAKLGPSLLWHIQNETNLDFITVVSVKKLLRQFHITIPNEVLCKAIKHSELYLLDRSSPIQHKSDSDSDNEDEDAYIQLVKKKEKPFLKENQITVKQDSICQYISSLSPFVGMGEKIPSELLVTSLVESFGRHTKLVPPSSVLSYLMEFSVKANSVRCVKSILLLAISKKIAINVEPFLNSLCFSDDSLLPETIDVFAFEGGFSTLSDAKINFLHSKTSNDFLEFVLFPGHSRRSSAIELVKLDPEFFLQSFKHIESYTLKSLKSICIYAQCARFDPNNFMKFIIELIQMFRNSNKKRCAAFRILTLFLYHNGANSTLIIPKITVLIKAELQFIEKQLASTITTKGVGIIAEIAMCLSIISRFCSINQIAFRLSQLIPKTTPFGLYLKFISYLPCTEEIYCVMDYYLPSVQLMPLLYYSRELKKCPNSCVQPATLALIFSKTFKHTSITEYILFNFLSVFIKDGVPSSQTSLTIDFIFRNFPASISSAGLESIISLLRSILPNLKSQQSSLTSIYSFVCNLFTVSILPSGACELLASVCRLLFDPRNAISIFTPYLRQFTTYNTYLINEFVGLYALKHLTISEDVINYVPFTEEFFSTFYAIVSIEKKKDMKHELMRNVFSSIHDESLKILSNKSLRPFSVFFALMQPSTSIPAPLASFIESLTSNKSDGVPSSAVQQRIIE